MVTEITKILQFIFQSLVHIWPYLLITIPFAVFIRLTGKFKSIDKYLRKRPFISILIATIIGAFSPFCSCGVIPVIASLLIGGVPIAPVMSFWLASPSMDPEMFFLSVSVLGWNIALWRLGATFFMSFAGGYVTHFLVKSGWLSGNLLRGKAPVSMKESLIIYIEKLKSFRSYIFNEKQSAVIAAECCYVQPCCNEIPVSNCCSGSRTVSGADNQDFTKGPEISFKKKLFKESMNSTIMVIKFMIIAFFLEALLILYVPSEFIVGILGNNNPFAVLIAALIGIPVYTSNLTALPVVGGLLVKGMSGGTALAFLISGPTTTIPAMAAVWNLTVKRVFFVYILITLIAAAAAGYLFDIVFAF